MEALFEKRQRVCDELAEEKDRALMTAMINEYNKAIRDAIVQFYKTRGNDVARMIEVCEKVKTCFDQDELDALKNEYETFCKSLKFNRLYLYDQDSRFPAWKREIIQEWYVYWEYPCAMSNVKTPLDSIQVSQTYYKKRDTHELVVAIDQTYNADNIWISIPDTILKCHRWRERYGLTHLDAIILHAK